MNKKLLLSAFLLSGLFTIFLFFSKSTKFPKISSKEHEILSLFCEHLLRYTTVGYTIFGDKPVSSFEIRKHVEKIPFEDMNPADILFYKSLPTLKTLFPYFSSQKYLIHLSETDEYWQFYIINKKSFIDVVKKNSDLFSNQLKTSYFKSIKTTNIYDLFKNNETLMGILYGFGRNNSIQYAKTGNKNLISTPKAFNEYDFFLFFPGFLCDPNDSETQQLVNKYKRQKKHLKAIVRSPYMLKLISQKLLQKEYLPKQAEERDTFLLSKEEKESWNLLFETFEKEAEKNLQKAESYLLMKSDSYTALKNKLLYDIAQNGVGNERVTKNHTPLVNLSISTIEGRRVSATNRGRLFSDETLPGITLGIIGMQKEEKRILYIHPDLAYGKLGHLPPNSLLIAEVEIIAF